MFWKIFFSLKCSYGHVECSFNKQAKEVDMMPKTSAQCLKMIKIFFVFQNSFFSKNVSIDTENAVLTGRPNFTCSLTGIDPKKSTKNAKTFQNFFLQNVPMER